MNECANRNHRCYDTNDHCHSVVANPLPFKFEAWPVCKCPDNQDCAEQDRGDTDSPEWRHER